MDLNGEITAVDTSGSSFHHLIKSNHFVGKYVTEFVHRDDISKIQQHLKDVLSKPGYNSSQFYRFKLFRDKFIQIQTKSRKFQQSNQDFIMATHSIINDDLKDDLFNVKQEVTMTSSTTASTTDELNLQLSPMNSNEFSLNECLGLNEMFPSTSNIPIRTPATTIPHRRQVMRM
ncbi:nuclear receptor coactivator 2-like protein [Leptotrombidium deliense]|uniref:Nuclear receptor coactivator 2-like protein n=1 Tax=Leptotrombidium deliense TaxID=299467 RepID=A0A443STL9_9ACAR|nr:nuclear receptor coactivator 2-like protein [Leptotrombidium deliense]